VIAAVLVDQRGELGVVMSIHLSVLPKCASQINRVREKTRQVNPEGHHVSFIPLVHESPADTRPADRPGHKHLRKVLAHLAEGSIEPHKYREAVPEIGGKGMDSIQHLFCAWQERSAAGLESTGEGIDVTRSKLPFAVCGHGPVTALNLNTQLDGKFGYLMHQQPHDYSRGRIAAFNGFLMLLLGNPLCLLCNTYCARRCLVSQEGDDSSGHRCDCADTNAEPFSQISHIVRKRTELDSHNPSLL